MRTMILGVFSALALATPAAAQGVTITAGVDVFMPVPGTTVVFSATTMPDATVIDSGMYGTVIVEQRLRFGRTNHVRMNLRYPHRHRVRGVVVNDYVWVNGRRTLASRAFHHYYAPRHRHAAYRHAHTFHSGYRVSGHHGHSAHRNGHVGRHPGPDRRHDHRDYERDRDSRDSCHEAGHPGRGHAYGKCKDKRGKNYAKAERERQREIEKERKKAEKEREKANKRRDKAEKRKDKKNNDGNNGRRGNGNGRGHKNGKKNDNRNRTRA